jgi:hypothetical protein
MPTVDWVNTYRKWLDVRPRLLIEIDDEEEYIV